MSNDPNNTSNPMKKRFRAWQPTPDEPPRRRRYPRLVVRDHTGNHIANDIATAPKVELPKQPFAPRAIAVPTSAVSNHDDELQEVLPTQDAPPRQAPLTVDSPVCAASTQDRDAQMQSRPSQPAPTSPALTNPTPVNNPGTQLRSSAHEDDYPAHRQPDVHPQEPLQTSSPPVRVNSLPMQAQSQHLSPRYDHRPVTAPGGVPGYAVSSCTPTPYVDPIAMTSHAQDALYAAQPVIQNLPQQATQYVVHNSPQRPTIYRPQEPEYGMQQTGPQLARAPAQVVAHPPGGPAPPEKVILAGKRCGTVEYWRSSLQMPRVKGVVKSLKAPAPHMKRRGKQGTPERADIAQSINPAPPPNSTSAPMRNLSAYVPGYASTHASVYNSERGAPDADYGGQSPRPLGQSPRPLDQSPRPLGQSPRPLGQSPRPLGQSPRPLGQSPRPLGQSPRPLGQSPRPNDQSPRPLSQSPRRPDSDIEHEFWRSATKLPRGSAESTRVKKLANGRRRIDGSATAYLGNPREAGGARSVHDAAVAGSPISGGQYGGAPQAGPVNPGMQTGYMPQASSVHGVQGSGLPMQVAQNMQANREQMAMRPGAYSTQWERMTRAKAESEKRRLLFLRDFELRRLRTLAQCKFHVKMNLRGRMKLEQWVCSDSVTFTASELIVILFNLDRRVLSRNDNIRRNALYDMTNEDLRILEALMCRIRSRGGRTNWELLTSSLSLESFVGTLPSLELT